MNFDQEADTPEQASFRQEVRAWFEEAMAGRGDLKWSTQWSTRGNEVEYEFRRDLAIKLGEKGWLFPTVAPEYGGGGRAPQPDDGTERRLTRAAQMIVAENGYQRSFMRGHREAVQTTSAVGLIRVCPGSCHCPA